MEHVIYTAAPTWSELRSLTTTALPESMPACLAESSTYWRLDEPVDLAGRWTGDWAEVRNTHGVFVLAVFDQERSKCPPDYAHEATVAERSAESLRAAYRTVGLAVHLGETPLYAIRFWEFKTSKLEAM